MTETADETIAAVLESSVIAVVGASRSPGKAAHDVPRYLLEAGYEIIPVNPAAEEIFGRPARDSLADVDERVDVVDVFRPSEEVPGIVEAAIDRPEKPAVWFQLGIRNDDAARLAERGGLVVVQDRCMKQEHARCTGGAT